MFLRRAIRSQPLRRLTALRARRFTTTHNFFDVKLAPEAEEALKEERFADEADVVIVGGGPAGLCAAIRTKQLCQEKGVDLRVVLIEKAPELGAHTLSGAVIEPVALNELLPDWRDMGAPLNQEVTSDRFYYLLNQSSRVPMPTPPSLHNTGNYIASLGNVCRWLGEQAEALGVEVFPGFAASELVYDEQSGAVKGIATSDVGVAKDGSLKPSFERGMEIHGKVTLLAEGCRGSLTLEAEERFGLRDGVPPQSYGIGLKEVWQVDPSKHEPGRVMHTSGWPVDNRTWGGSFMYHWDDNQVSIGFVVGLDYENPHLSPYRTFQQWKTHESVASVLDGGECVSYGARALNEGGYQCIPKLAFPGGALLGCAAGFLNVPKVKGSHNAMKSGMLAAEAAVAAITDTTREGSAVVLDEYEQSMRSSRVWDEMYRVRNIRPSFRGPLGTIGGMIYSGIDDMVLRGRAPWTFKAGDADHHHIKKRSECQPPEYPKPDGKLTFDLLTNLSRSGTNHEEDQPAHLRLRKEVNDPEEVYPLTTVCPAGVYELVPSEDGSVEKLTINAQNCVHCKSCSIRCPDHIRWTTPESGGGPAYSGM